MIFPRAQGNATQPGPRQNLRPWNAGALVLDILDSFAAPLYSRSQMLLRPSALPVGFIEKCLPTKRRRGDRFPACLQTRAGGIVSKRKDSRYISRRHAALDQVQEPASAGSEAGSRGGLGQMAQQEQAFESVTGPHPFARLPRPADLLRGYQLQPLLSPIDGPG